MQPADADPAPRRHRPAQASGQYGTHVPRGPALRARPLPEQRGELPRSISDALTLVSRSFRRATSPDQPGLSGSVPVNEPHRQTKRAPSIVSGIALARVLVIQNANPALGLWDCACGDQRSLGATGAFTWRIHSSALRPLGARSLFHYSAALMQLEYLSHAAGNVTGGPLTFER